MLRIRLATGVERTGLPVDRIDALVADGLVAPAAADSRRLVLTLRGRLLADAVVRSLTDVGQHS